MSLAGIFGVILLAIAVILIVLYIMYPEYFEEGYYVVTADDGYTCLADIGTSNVPMKVMPDGNIACMSANGKDCLWSDACHAQLLAYRKKPTDYDDPLVCGAAHAVHWGDTGYNYKDANGKSGAHWCQKAQNAEKVNGAFNVWNRIKTAAEYQRQINQALAAQAAKA